jgi:nitroreductase
VDEKYLIPFVITFGYPAENPEQRGRKPLKELVLARL